MMRQLESYRWPGNIRELQNIIEQSTILNDGRSELQPGRSLGFFEPDNPEPTQDAIKDLTDLKKAQQLEKTISFQFSSNRREGYAALAGQLRF